MTPHPPGKRNLRIIVGSVVSIETKVPKIMVNYFAIKKAYIFIFFFAFVGTSAGASCPEGLHKCPDGSCKSSSAEC